MFNKDLNESGNDRIYVPGSHAEASLTRLAAPSDDATSGVLLGGQTFDGSLDVVALGTRAEETIVPNSNVICTVSLDQGSAALLTLPTGGSADLGAGAGVDQTALTGNSVMLDGRDSYGSIDTYTWVQTSGPATRLLDANTPSPHFTPYDAGVYTFALTVTSSGTSATDTVDVTVSGENVVIYIEESGEVVFEAEVPSQIQPGVGDFINHTWTSVSYGDASGGQYMKCTPDDSINAKGAADGPVLELRIQFTTVGSYQVHVRTPYMWGWRVLFPTRKVSKLRVIGVGKPKWMMRLAMGPMRLSRSSPLECIRFGSGNGKKGWTASSYRRIQALILKLSPRAVMSRFPLERCLKVQR